MCSRPPPAVAGPVCARGVYGGDFGLDWVFLGSFFPIRSDAMSACRFGGFYKKNCKLGDF